MHRRPRSSIPLALAVVVAASPLRSVAQDVQVFDQPPSADMEVSDDAPSLPPAADMEISDDPPADFERNDIDRPQTWQQLGQ